MTTEAFSVALAQPFYQGIDGHPGHSAATPAGPVASAWRGFNNYRGTDPAEGLGPKTQALRHPARKSFGELTGYNNPGLPSPKPALVNGTSNYLPQSPIDA